MPHSIFQKRFLGIAFAQLNYQQATAEIELLSQGSSFSFVVTPNVDHALALAPAIPTERNNQFDAAYGAAAIRFCDSRVLQALAKLRGVGLSVVTGSDLTERLFKQQFATDQIIAIVGGDPGDAQILADLFPGPKFVQHCPPMGILDNAEAVADIFAFLDTQQADYAFFAFGAPQSEIVAHQYQVRGTGRGVGLCVGASIEFLIGRKTRAPKWMQRAGLEWAFRLLQEPGRLWRRYLVTGPRILLLAAKWRNI